MYTLDPIRDPPPPASHIPHLYNPMPYRITIPYLMNIYPLLSFKTIALTSYEVELRNITLGDNGESRFSKTNPHTKSAKLTYSISKKILTIGRKRYTTVDYPNAMWTKGIYDIEIPDYPHAGGNAYPNNKHATTWFRIYHPEDRYLHTGERSLGCITVTENNRWDELYTLLIAARKGDDKNIGTVKVIE